MVFVLCWLCWVLHFLHLYLVCKVGLTQRILGKRFSRESGSWVTFCKSLQTNKAVSYMNCESEEKQTVRNYWLYMTDSKPGTQNLSVCRAVDGYVCVCVCVLFVMWSISVNIHTDVWCQNDWMEYGCASERERWGSCLAPVLLCSIR